MRICIRLSASILAVAAASAHAHARWSLTGLLKPRNDSTGLKTAPCGGVPGATDPSKRAVLQKGAVIEVEFEETIQHPGHYRIAFSAEGDGGYEQNIILDNIPDNQDDANTPHVFKSTITVPNIDCGNCAFQLIQVMTDRDPPSNYYSCADVIIGKPATSTATATATSTATATATDTDTDTGSDTDTATSSDDETESIPSDEEEDNAMAAPTNVKVVVERGTKEESSTKGGK